MDHALSMVEEVMLKKERVFPNVLSKRSTPLITISLYAEAISFCLMGTKGPSPHNQSTQNNKDRGAHILYRFVR